METIKPDVPQEEDQLLEGHAYDGIQEYDNDLPMWWTVIFMMTVLWALIYYIGTFTGNVRTYQEDLAYQNVQINNKRAIAISKMPTLTPQSLSTLLKESNLIATGNSVYATACVSCHGTKGEGGIGPNLTDNFWINGATEMRIYETISKGVTTKGMPAWENSIGLEGRVALVAFIQTLKNTNPPNAKAPQGAKAL